MILITGIIYPVFVTGISQILFSKKANGSLIVIKDKVRGSGLIGQVFDSSYYFLPRPSASSYGTIPSAGSNLGPTSDSLRKLVIIRRKQFVSLNATADTLNIPSEMIFASGSGLDPHISPEAALLQLNRISKARSFDDDHKKQLMKLITEQTENRQIGIFGEKRVNVLLLNLKLDEMSVNNTK